MDKLRTLNDLSWAPTLLGELYYPGGFPINEEKFACCGDTIRKLKNELFRFHLNTIQMDSAKLDILLDWFAYYVHAPCFQIQQYDSIEFSQWQEKSLNLKTVSELMEWASDGLDYGMDVL